ncbi:allantoicase [Kitasatospora sp. NBC_01287]|uniref:allantoicase n=1 Tax=Kitasatospora sp. NBC_01287 TaxID=2903573 RepID=UPI00224D446C|nr:allantoicase [Kitasatospora sp. NBC_01287]MCX4747887.1 allantoicase [Kitasatospora sp. NBC_01287]
MTTYDPGYADYQDLAADAGYRRLPDLADRRLGAAVLAASDEHFAERENLLRPETPRFRPHTFGPKGQLMDGWESRRRRGADTAHPHPVAADHDWALIRLGLPGVIQGIVVDTAHFRGNPPQRISVEAAELPGLPGPAELLDAAVPWHEIVAPSAVAGHAANGFAVTDGRRFTHLRLKQFPDGGIARLRVHGTGRPDPAWLAALGSFDLAALEHGGSVEDASDRFFSPPVNLIMPGRSREMGEGWENRRRRDQGHDWVRLRLAGRGVVRALEVDTGNYLGNAAGWAAVLGFDATDPRAGDPADHAAPGWFELLPRTALQPDAVHRFVLGAAAGEAPGTAPGTAPGEAAGGAAQRPATHARIDVFPDGGVARLRLHGSLA